MVVVLPCQAPMHTRPVTGISHLCIFGDIMVNVHPSIGSPYQSILTLMCIHVHIKASLRWIIQVCNYQVLNNGGNVNCNLSVDYLRKTLIILINQNSISIL